MLLSCAMNVLSSYEAILVYGCSLASPLQHV